jgi:hypothetical protein
MPNRGSPPARRPPFTHAASTGDFLARFDVAESEVRRTQAVAHPPDTPLLKERSAPPASVVLTHGVMTSRAISCGELRRLVQRGHGAS